MEPIESAFYYVNLILPIIVLAAGIFGNITGIAVLMVRAKQLVKMGPSYIISYLLIADTVYLHQIITSYIIIGLNNNFQLISNLYCKLNRYLSYSLAPISPWLLAYISVDRLISIRFSVKREYLRKNSVQFLYFVFLTAFNMLYYYPVAYFSANKTFGLNNNGTFELVEDSNKMKFNSTMLVCTLYTDPLAQAIVIAMNSINSVFLPFIIMIVSTILLIHLIITSRRRVHQNLTRENAIIRRDIKFARTAISFNLYFLITNLPLNLLAYLPFFSSPVFFLLNMLFYYIFMASYAGNFYIILLSNTLFKREFFKIFSCIQLRTQSSVN